MSFSSSPLPVKRTVLTLVPIDMLLVGYSFLRIPILEQALRTLGASKLAAGIAFGAYSAIGALSMLLRGWLADSVENRKPLILSLAGITILGSLIVVLVDGSIGFIVGMAISGVGSLGVYPVGYVVITDLVPPARRSTAYSLRSLINGIGQGVVAVYAIFIGVPLGIKAAVYAYVLSLLFFSFLYASIGSNIPPAKGWRRPKFTKFLKIARESSTNKLLFTFTFFYAIPWGAMQVRTIAYFVESRGLSDTMASVMLGILAAPAVLSIFLVYLVELFYDSKRVRVRPIAAGIAIVLFSTLFMRFFSIDYKRAGGITKEVPEALALLLSMIASDKVLRDAYFIGAVAFIIAGTVGPLKNGVLADGNLPEYKGIIYSSLSVIDSIARGLGAFAAGAIGELYGLGMALKRIPIMRIPSAFLMRLIAKVLPRDYELVQEEIKKRLEEGSGKP